MTRSLLVLAVFAATAAAQRADAPFTNINPSWSPDGTRLVFESRRHPGRTEIYVINVDGTGERRLTVSDSSVENTHPSWSPDGTTIAFDSNRDRSWNIYVIGADGGNARRVTSATGPTSPSFARHPEWSPDGRLIAFDSDRDGNGELYVIRPDGSGLHRITNAPGNDSHPMWTNLGELVTVRRDSTSRSLWGVNLEQGVARPLFDAGRFYSGLNIAPDGRHFTFMASGEPTPRLYVAPMDRSWEPRAITPEGRTSYEAAWSRDGTRVAFYHDATGVHEIYIVNADGTGLRQVTGPR